jgi:N-carbamoylputrescine amidase
MRFYGHSFITDERGDLVSEFGDASQGVLDARFDLLEIRKHRATFGFFRDRRPDMYGRLVADI